VGWRGNDLDATIDLKPVTPFHSIQMRFLQQGGSWALLPRHVYAVSDDGKTWRTLQSTPIAVDPMDLRAMIRTVRFDAAAPVTARYRRAATGLLPGPYCSTVTSISLTALST
jgi:hexosaminidase